METREEIIELSNKANGYILFANNTKALAFQEGFIEGFKCARKTRPTKIKYNYENTNVGDIFVPEYENIKDRRYHGEIIEVSSWGVLMNSPWLESIPLNSVTWLELNECNFRKPKSLNKKK